MIGSMAGVELRLLLLAVSVRLTYLAACILLDWGLADYDSSKKISRGGHGLFQGLVVWDAVFFEHIAKSGYTVEQFFAFFPLLPGTWARSCGVSFLRC
jgi:hypothetical protein